MKKGKFIVIEGSDGSGKKTQTDLLIKRLKEKKIKTSYFDFPQYYTSFFGKMITRYLNGEFGTADEVSPYLASILYAGDRFEASEKIRDDLDNGKYIISNRYIQSNMAFQTAKIRLKSEKKKFLNWLEKIEYEIFKIPKADLVIYLYVPYKIGQELVDKKGKRKYSKQQRDIHERDGDFLCRVEKEYLNLAETRKEWQIINCIENGKILSREKIAEKVYAIVKKTT